MSGYDAIMIVIYIFSQREFVMFPKTETHVLSASSTHNQMPGRVSAILLRLSWRDLTSYTLTSIRNTQQIFAVNSNP